MIAFGAPQFLWLLAVPSVCLAAWLWRFGSRLSDLRRLRERRSTPIRERFGLGGDLWLWLFLILATASLAVAVARPHGVTTIISRPGVVLIDRARSSQDNDSPLY